MMKFNVGAVRPANDDLCNARLAAANDLVQRTLAQHGLMPQPNGVPDGPVEVTLPSLDLALARFKNPRHDSPDPIELPDGAVFRKGRSSCASGSRDYRAYVPSTAADGVAGIIVMLHGCTQTSEDFATGTGMNALAEEGRFVVLYPKQSRGSNMQSCWNWFSRGDQRRGQGEPEILANMTRDLMQEFEVPPAQTFVAGLSAGAAMAIILAEAYPDIFSAVGAHSGLPFGAAKDVQSALAAMGGAPVEETGARSDGPAVRSIVFHGSADATVHPSNGARIARDALGRCEGQTVETETQGHASGRRFSRTVTSRADGMVHLEHWVVDGLGHAWSGGRPGGSYVDPKGPDASAEMVRFFFDQPPERL